jgi:hypothetical protein
MIARNGHKIFQAHDWPIYRKSDQGYDLDVRHCYVHAFEDPEMSFGAVL